MLGALAMGKLKQVQCIYRCIQKYVCMYVHDFSWNSELGGGEGGEGCHLDPLSVFPFPCSLGFLPLPCEGPEQNSGSCTSLPTPFPLPCAFAGVRGVLVVLSPLQLSIWLCGQVGGLAPAVVPRGQVCSLQHLFGEEMGHVYTER